MYSFINYSLQLLIYLFYSFKYSNNLIKSSKGGISAKETLNPYWIRNIVIAVSFLWIILTMYVLEIMMQTYLYVIYIEPIYYSVIYL